MTASWASWPPTASTRHLYADFLRHDALPAGLAAAPAVLRAPRRVWETLRHGRGDHDLPAAEVLSIAVAADAGGQGTGGALLAAALDALARQGVTEAQVVTAVGNQSALAMYERAGFRHRAPYRGPCRCGAGGAGVALIVAAALTAVLTPVAMRVATATGVVDRPGELKVHEHPVAYLGGVAVFAGMAVPVAFEQAALLVPLGLALALGLADDVADLAPGLRLLGELGVGVAAALALPAPLTALGWVATVVVVVGLLNAVNLLDGLDGLASSVAALGALGFAFVLDGGARVPALALAGALVGFLLWNRPPARIYLGDAGSYLVGTALALLLAATVTGHDAVAPSAGALLFVAVPVADTTVAVVRRQRAGRPLLQGDRGHVYDQLVDRGWTTGRAVLACAAAQAALVLVGLAASTMDDRLAVAVVARCDPPHGRR